MALEKEIKLSSSLNENDLLRHRISLERLTVLNTILQNNLSEESNSLIEKQIIKIIETW